MFDMIDLTNATDVLLSEPPEVPAATPESHNELGATITSLWSAHVNAKNTARATSEELRRIRAKLGEQLSEMKKMLAKPGCDGGWSSFLRDHDIPRATADRLVALHLRSLDPDDANRLAEAGPESTEEEVRKVFTSVWPKLRRTLRSQQSIHLFVGMLTSHYESGEPTGKEGPAIDPANPTISAQSDGDSTVQPELCSARHPGLDQGVISVP